MGDPKGFLKINRKDAGYRPVEERLHDYREVEIQLPDEDRKLQASRCMDCGVPFCHWACPLSNIMPEWQDMIYKGEWETAYNILQETNNFPEFTGRVCPAPCEAACVLSINDDAVTIRNNELYVIEKAYKEGLVKPRQPEKRSGKKVAVIGSGPAGLACSDILNKLGHTVVLFEADEKVGGYLRYGIPDFKLEKSVIDRRVEILKQEGLTVKTESKIGKKELQGLIKEYDAVCLTIGARKARDLNIPGRELKGIHFALDYLSQQNKIVSGVKISENELIRAYNKNVLVIGGGDTGSDCVGSVNRQGAASVTQVEVLPKPPETRSEKEPWPLWPKLFKTSSSHEEGCERLWNISVKEFRGNNGAINKALLAKLEWSQENGKPVMKEIPGSEFELDVDLVLLAMGFVHIEYDLTQDMAIELNPQGNIKTDSNCMTSADKIFAAGDSVMGASLIVKAIAQGRESAMGIDRYLNGLKK